MASDEAGLPSPALETHTGRYPIPYSLTPPCTCTRSLTLPSLQSFDRPPTTMLEASRTERRVGPPKAFYPATLHHPDTLPPPPKRLTAITSPPPPHPTPSTPPHHPGEVLLGDLTRAGFSVTDDHEDSDAIIVNTCAFVEDAKSESLEVGAQQRGWQSGACLPLGARPALLRWSCTGAAQPSAAPLSHGAAGQLCRAALGLAVCSRPHLRTRAGWTHKHHMPLLSKRLRPCLPHLHPPALLLTHARTRTPHVAACTPWQAIVEAASLNEDGRRRKVVVTGCLAQRYAGQLAADLPEADLVVGFQVGVGVEGCKCGLGAGNKRYDPAQVAVDFLLHEPCLASCARSCSKHCVQLPEQAAHGRARPSCVWGPLRVLHRGTSTLHALDPYAVTLVTTG